MFTRAFIVSFMLICLFLPASAQNSKIGLVLSGGGAKGFAHIGTLELLDSLDIKVDYIAGTSMGGILGALYSIGYSGHEIEALVRATDWQQIFSDSPPRDQLPWFQKKDVGRYQVEFGLKGFTPTLPSGLISGQKIGLLFSRLTFAYERVPDFDHLPIPYRCIAADLISCSEKVIRQGSLAQAMRATMSIPTIFSPVVWGDSLLVDGGILNNLPVDVARQMGADKIIAVNVGATKRKMEEFQSIFDVLDQTIWLQGIKKQERLKLQSDVLIEPHLSGYSAADFERQKVDRIISRGKKAAKKALPELLNYVQRPTAQVWPKIVFGIRINGNTSIPFSWIYRQFGFTPGDTLTRPNLLDAIERLESSPRIEHISYTLKTVRDNRTTIELKVSEREKPVIHSIVVNGNRQFTFKFIYNLLGLEPGDLFDSRELEERITAMYSLGYFELIDYKIEPVNESAIRLRITIREREKRRLRIALRYDNFYQLVAAVGVQGTNLPLDGMRAESELQFAGLTRLNVKIYRPSRTLDYPLYPFVALRYKDVPIQIYNTLGNKIASYGDRSLSGILGFGILISNAFNLELGISRELMDIKPEIALTESGEFPAWKDRLNQLQANFNYDTLDDLLLPRHGTLFRSDNEWSTEIIGSEINYLRSESYLDHYVTFSSRHTLHSRAAFFYSAQDIPLYKMVYAGGPDNFIGLDYHQLTGKELITAGLEYRFEYKKDIFLSTMVNIATNIRFVNATTSSKPVIGYGIGLTLLSPIGPLKMIFSGGDRTPYHPGAKTRHFYFQAGYRF